MLEWKVNTNESKIHVNTAKNLYNNVKIAGLSESLEEVPTQVARNFFTNIMKLKLAEGDILEASRMSGSLRRHITGKQIDLPRLLYVKCSPTFRRTIEENKGVLKGKQDEHTKVRYSIKNHLPDAHYAARQRYAPMIRSILKDRGYLTCHLLENANFSHI